MLRHVHRLAAAYLLDPISPHVCVCVATQGWIHSWGGQTETPTHNLTAMLTMLTSM